MKSWFPMMAAGVAALLGGLVALVNPTSASVTTVTLAGWALLVVAALQGWAAWRAETIGARFGSGTIALAAAFLGLSMLLGPFGSGRLLQILLSLLLLASGGAKIYAALPMAGSQNQMLVFGAGAVSAIIGVVVLLGLNLNFGIIVGVELLASGLGLVLLAMHRRSSPTA